MCRIVQGIFMSLWCVCFTSAEARCHICHVCSGFCSLLLITLYRPHEGAEVCKHELASACFFSSPECIGVLFGFISGSDILYFVQFGCFFLFFFFLPNYVLVAHSHLVVLWKSLILNMTLKKEIWFISQPSTSSKSLYMQCTLILLALFHFLFF